MILLASCIAISIAQTTPGSSIDQSEKLIIAAYLRKHAAAYNRTWETSDGEYDFAIGDIFCKGSQDLVVLFATVDGNYYSQSVAVFRRTKSGLQPHCVKVVGGKGTARIDSIQISHGRVLMKGFTYCTTDPLLAPCRKTNWVLRVKGSHLEYVSKT